MNLHDASDRHGADLDKGETPEVARLQNVYLALIAKQNVLLVEERMPIHRPEPAAEPGLIQSIAVVGIMHMVVIHRRKPGQKHRAANERPRPLNAAENMRGA